MYIICVSYALGFHFKAFGMINFQYEIRVFNKFLIKPQMTKTSQYNNLNCIHFLKHFYEYHNEKLKYRDVACLISKILSWYICYYCFLLPSSVNCRAWICNCSNRPLLWAHCPSYLFSLMLTLLLNFWSTFLVTHLVIFTFLTNTYQMSFGGRVMSWFQFVTLWPWK